MSARTLMVVAELDGELLVLDNPAAPSLAADPGTAVRVIDWDALAFDEGSTQWPPRQLRTTVRRPSVKRRRPATSSRQVIQNLALGA